jgi:uncharacterized membrane protein
LTCLFAIALLAMWLSQVTAVKVESLPGIPPEAERIASWIAAPDVLLRSMFAGVILLPEHIHRTWFTFGWLNIGPVWPSQILCGTALACVILVGEHSVARLRLAFRIWFLAIAMAITLAILFALLLTFTPPGRPAVDGLQGRYFTPVLPLLLFALLPARQILIRATLYVPWLMVAANVTVLLVIAKVFYRL